MQGQTIRSAVVSVRIAMERHLKSMTITHKYSNNYQDVYSWQIIDPGIRTPFDMRVNNNTGAITTGKDWWIVIWTYEKDASSMYLFYTYPNNFQSFIDGVELSWKYSIPVTTSAGCCIPNKGKSTWPLLT